MWRSTKPKLTCPTLSSRHDRKNRYAPIPACADVRSAKPDRTAPAPRRSRRLLQTRPFGGSSLDWLDLASGWIWVSAVAGGAEDLVHSSAVTFAVKRRGASQPRPEPSCQATNVAAISQVSGGGIDVAAKTIRARSGRRRRESGASRAPTVAGLPAATPGRPLLVAGVHASLRCGQKMTILKRWA
jgi:hypothetical protein